jgi:hypothetical protein
VPKMATDRIWRRFVAATRELRISFTPSRVPRGVIGEDFEVIRSPTQSLQVPALLWARSKPF